MWQTGSGTTGQYLLPVVGDGQCAGVGPTIVGSNASFTVLRNTLTTYSYGGTLHNGASTCSRNQMNPVDPNTGTNYLLTLGTFYRFTFQTIVTLNGNYLHQGAVGGGLAADIPAIVWQTHSYGGDAGSCAGLVIHNTYAAWIAGVSQYGAVSQGGLPVWNFHSCAEGDYGAGAYWSPDTLHDGEVDDWRIDMTPQITGGPAGSIVVFRNGLQVYSSTGAACDASTALCFWNFGPYMFYWSTSEEPPGWNDAGVTVQMNSMTLAAPSPSPGPTASPAPTTPPAFAISFASQPIGAAPASPFLSQKFADGTTAAGPAIAIVSSAPVLSDASPSAKGDVVFYKTTAPLRDVEESFSFLYSGPNTVVYPIFVDPSTAYPAGDLSNLVESAAGIGYAGNVGYQSMVSGEISTAIKGRLPSEPFYYQVGHTYRVDAISQHSTGLLTTRVYDVALGSQAFCANAIYCTATINQGISALASYPGMYIHAGNSPSIVDFSFGPVGSLPVSAHPARRAYDYLNHLGYNQDLLGLPTASPKNIAFTTFFPQTLIKHVRESDSTTGYQTINSLSGQGINVDVLTGPGDTPSSLATFLPKLALPPDSIEMWNEPNNGSSTWPTPLATWAAQVQTTYGSSYSIWGPSFLNTAGFPTAMQQAKSLMGTKFTAWNTHNYAQDRPESTGYGGSFSNACGPSLTEDCGLYGATNWNDNESAVINPALPGVATEGVGSYGSYPAICGHTNVDFNSQQAYLERGLLYDFKMGHLRDFPYKFMDDGGGCTDGFGTYGILSTLVDVGGNKTYYPKPAYVSLVYLNNLLSDSGASAATFTPTPLSYGLVGASPDVEELLLAQSDGSYRLVLWSDNSLWNFNANGTSAVGAEYPLASDPVIVQLATPASAEVFSQEPGTGIWSAGAPANSTTSVSVTVNQYPLVIDIAPGTQGFAILPSAVPTVGPTETPTSSPTTSPTATPSASPSPTASPSPSPTATPTASPSPSPTATSTTTAALTLYGALALNGAIGSAGSLGSATGGAETSRTTIANSGSNFVEVWSQGSAGSASVATIPATPTGNGWAHATGAGTFSNASWAASANLALAGWGGTIGQSAFTIRFFKYSGGTYSLIGSASNATVAGNTKTDYQFSSSALPATTFLATDLLYVDLWYQDTTGAGGDNPTVYEATTSTNGVANDIQVTTPLFGIGTASPSPSPSASVSPSPSPSPTATASGLTYRFALNPNPMTRRACIDPCSPTLDSNSSAWISTFFSGGLGSWLVPASTSFVGPGDNVFYTDSSNPGLTNSHPHTVTCVEFGGCGSRTIYIPDGAFAANSAGDWHMSIIDRSTGIEWGFWEMNETCAGCVGNGNAISGTGPVTNGYLGECDTGAFPLGGTTNNCQPDTGQSYQGSNMAIGVPASVGNIQPAEWASGNIPHVLWIVSTCTNGQGSNFEYPASGSDGHTAGCPFQGARLWLDLTDAQINALGDPPWATTMLHNLHDYGWILADTAGGGGPIIDFTQLGSGTWTFNGGTDPWPAFYAAQSNFSSNIPTNGLSGHLHFVDPCISEGSC